MTKSDTFAVTVASVGLVADIVAIAAFFGFSSANDAAASTMLNTRALAISTAFLLFYAWFTFTFVFAKKMFLREGPDVLFDKKVIAQSVFACGLALLPLWVGHGVAFWSGGAAPLLVIILPVLGGSLYFSVGLLLPLFIDEMGPVEIDDLLP